MSNEEIKASNYVQNVRNFRPFAVGVFEWDVDVIRYKGNDFKFLIFLCVRQMKR